MLKLNPKQNEYIRNANARWCLKVGAVRSGKSFCDVAYVILSRLRAVKDLTGLNVIIGVSRETIERNVLQPMRELYTSEVVGSINSRGIAIVAGVPVYCIGAEKASQVAKIQGMSVKYCYGDEIAKWSQPVFDLLKSRLDKSYSRFDGSCNPESPSHWLKKFIERDDLDIYVQKYTIFDNPALSKEFVENLCREYEGTVYYRRFILGEWVKAEGLVYPMFSPEKHVIDEYDRRGQYYISIDYGTLNPCVFLLWRVNYNFPNCPIVCVKEYYYSGRGDSGQKTDNQYYDDLETFAEGYRIERIIVDPSAASFKALIRQKGKFSVRDANNDVLDGLRFTGTLLQDGYVKFDRSCENTFAEFGSYVWDEQSETDKVIKENDHCMDALRYMMYTIIRKDGIYENEELLF